MSDTAITAGALPAPKSEEGIWGFSRAQFGALVVMVVFLAAAPFVLYPVFLMKLLCFALFALAFNLLIGPVVVGASGVLLERLMIAPLYKLDHLYGLLLTFGVGLIIEGIFRNEFGSSGLPYRIPAELSGAWDLGFMFMPVYRGWVVLAALILCLATWLVIEKTRLGAYLRAATERAELVQAFGVNVPLMITLTYGAGVALAAIGGVLAAPIYSVNPQMGVNLIIVVFAVVVIGGMGSILGSVLTGFGLGVVEGLTKVFWPEASATVIFVIMAIVLLTRPAGLFGRA